MTPEELAAIKARADCAGVQTEEDILALVAEVERLQRLAMEVISRYEQAQYAVFAESGYRLSGAEESRLPAYVAALRAHVHAADKLP